MFGKKPAVEPKPSKSKSALEMLGTHDRDDEWENTTIPDVLTALKGKAPRGYDAGTSTAVMDSGDGEGSLKNGYGSDGNVGSALGEWYARQGFIGHQISGLVAQHWLVLKACAMLPRDAIRNGWDIVSADGDDLDPKIVKYQKRIDKQFNIKGKLVEFGYKGRIFGIRIMIYKVDSPDPDYYEKPFNIDGVMPGAYKGMVQVDPYWTSPMLDSEAASQPDSAHFYEPTYWKINSRVYHRSHLVIFRTDQPVDILRPNYQYGGIPLPQQIMERVYAAERTANEGPQLAMSKRLTVFYTNMAKALTNWTKFKESMSEWMDALNNFGVKIADKQNDEIDQKDTSLTDVDTVIMTQYQLVAAIAREPATKLMGTSPKGFGASGDYETESYHEELESSQEHDYTPAIDRHYQLSARSYIEPYMGVPKGSIRLTAEWSPLSSPTPVELAAINYQKAQTADLYIQMGVIDEFDERERLRHDKSSGYTSIPEVARAVLDAASPDSQPPVDPNPALEHPDNRPPNATPLSAEDSAHSNDR